ncbi:ankyrin repeat 30A-like protein [Actinidia rufa]|uniref:RAB6-interacting golgin n=1 Tax=Actinidia rufa TaxID=165716 RepID=A0A7J0HB75_9ERIC|nr:ankyrin repeat 30A-like protein [Actinidia rufa]
MWQFLNVKYVIRARPKPSKVNFPNNITKNQPPQLTPPKLPLSPVSYSVLASKALIHVSVGEPLLSTPQGKRQRREEIRETRRKQEKGDPKQEMEQQQSQMLRVKNSGILSYNGSPMIDDKDEEMTMSALSAFRAKEEEIERKKMEELQALADPMRKEVAIVRKRVDIVNRELKPLGQTCQKKEKEYKEALEAFNEKNSEKAQLLAKLMELVSESERLRMKKLEELSKNLDSLH